MFAVRWLAQEPMGLSIVPSSPPSSSRVLNVSVWNVPGAPIVFNHMTTPNVVC